MKRQIRRGCFETNSSSMHSLVVTKEDSHFTPKECEDSVWVWNGKLHMDLSGEMEFERSPFDVLRSFNDKLRYAIASFCGGYTTSKTADEIFENEFIPIIKEILPDVTKVDFNHVRNTIYYDDNGNEIQINGWDDDSDEPYYYVDGEKRIPEEREEETIDYGSIDHQSMGLLQGFLKEEGISLKEFLTNKKYVVIIDGDEYDTFGKLKEAGMINLAEIEREYPPDGGSYDGYVWRKGRKHEETD